jgi:hydrogenase expression/formation protein
MDLEEHARRLYKEGFSRKEILDKIKMLCDGKKAEALLKEIEHSENLDSFSKWIGAFPRSIDADDSGLGCRGKGDFFIHRCIADIIGRTNAIIDSTHQDDAGIVAVEDKYICMSVDGIHSRLSHFPFLAGFHVARAALRDVVVMGARPLALFSDAHLANNADVGKIFDYTAGISTVGELTSVPLICGSTLRIGGDMVLGDRLSGCVGAVGCGTNITPRKNAAPGDVMIITLGSGGGTVATTAIYNGYPHIIKETLNIDFLNTAIHLLEEPFFKNVHALTDVTNGGIRGDAFQIAETADVKIILNEKKLRGVVNTNVLKMLDDLCIDFKGISIDSLLVISPPELTSELLYFFKAREMKADIVGHVEQGKGVYLEKARKIKKMEPLFREEPYTPIKKAVGTITPSNWDEMKKVIEKAKKQAIQKKERMKEWIREKNEME